MKKENVIGVVGRNTLRGMILEKVNELKNEGEIKISHTLCSIVFDAETQLIFIPENSFRRVCMIQPGSHNKKDSRILTTPGFSVDDIPSFILKDHPFKPVDFYKMAVKSLYDDNLIIPMLRVIANTSLKNVLKEIKVEGSEKKIFKKKIQKLLYFIEQSITKKFFKEEIFPCYSSMLSFSDTLSNLYAKLEEIVSLVRAENVDDSFKESVTKRIIALKQEVSYSANSYYNFCQKEIVCLTPNRKFDIIKKISHIYLREFLLSSMNYLNSLDSVFDKEEVKMDIDEIRSVLFRRLMSVRVSFNQFKEKVEEAERNSSLVIRNVGRLLEATDRKMISFIKSFEKIFDLISKQERKVYGEMGHPGIRRSIFGIHLGEPNRNNRVYAKEAMQKILNEGLLQKIIESTNEMNLESFSIKPIKKTPKEEETVFELSDQFDFGSEKCIDCGFRNKCLKDEVSLDVAFERMLVEYNGELSMKENNNSLKELIERNKERLLPNKSDRQAYAWFFQSIVTILEDVK